MFLFLVAMKRFSLFIIVLTLLFTFLGPNVSAEVIYKGDIEPPKSDKYS